MHLAHSQTVFLCIYMKNENSHALLLDIRDIYHFDTSHQRKPQGYISNIPWEPVYIMIYPAAMVTSY